MVEVAPGYLADLLEVRHLVELVLEVLDVHLGVVVVVARLGVKYLVTVEAVLVTVLRTVDWLCASARCEGGRGNCQ